MSMDDRVTGDKKNKNILVIGVGGLLVFVVLLAGFGIVLFSQISGDDTTSGKAMLYIDVPGRVAIDGNLQINGPAPVLVEPGSHSVVALDSRSALAPPVINVAANEFKYVTENDVSSASSYRYSYNQGNGAVLASVFPPDSTIEVPDCTPVNSRNPRQCRNQHTANFEVSPGTYRINFTNPHYPSYTETFSATSGGITRINHSFIKTMDEWEEWRKNYGDVIERRGGRVYYGGDAALFLPFEAAGEVVEEIFD